MAVTARGCRNGNWFDLEHIEATLKAAAELLRQKGIESEIFAYRCGTPGLTLLVRDEDQNEYRYSISHGGHYGLLHCFGRTQRYDVVTPENIAKAFLKRL